MTICVAALAAEGKAVVCVADKSVTYGESITGESDSTKIVGLSANLLAMISGNQSECETLLGKLGRNKKLGESISDTIQYCQRCYAEVRSELLRIRVLAPNLIDETQITAAYLAPEINIKMQELIDLVARFRIECDVILCGFDENRKAFILHLTNPGEVNDASRLGYAAIGSGWEYAVAGLIGSEWTRKKTIDETLFHILDAKIEAEISPFIGGDWDASVVIAGQHIQVPETIRDVLDKAWVQNRSPYWEREPDDLDPPPDDWKKQLRDYAESIIAPSPDISGDGVAPVT